MANKKAKAPKTAGRERGKNAKVKTVSKAGERRKQPFAKPSKKAVASKMSAPKPSRAKAKAKAVAGKPVKTTNQKPASKTPLPATKRRATLPKKKVLIVGSGGREHALAWGFAASPHVGVVYCAPGNAGTADVGQNVPIGPEDIEALVRFARNEKVDLTVIGPEAPLALGIVDRFRAAKLAVFGPTKAAAQIETSKIFAKELLLKAGVPTAPAEIFTTAEAANRYIDISGAPCVIKADGLAAGKGVTVAMAEEEAYAAIKEIMVDKRFGDAGERILIEDYISGEEASVFALTDGERYALMLPAQDHKRLRDGDDGPNTGGMGAYVPAPIIDAKTQTTVAERIIEPVLKELAARGTPFRGLLYVGLIVDFEGPKVLEFNARFGDPETQAFMPLLLDDLYELCAGVAAGKLETARLNWKPGAAATVVTVSKGYPGHYETGKVIRGLDDVAGIENVYVFHGGTARDANGRLVTAGGRVLAVTAVGININDAVKRAYDAVGRIKFAGITYRRDIGHKATARNRE